MAHTWIWSGCSVIWVSMSMDFSTHSSLAICSILGEAWHSCCPNLLISMRISNTSLQIGEYGMLADGTINHILCGTDI